MAEKRPYTNRTFVSAAAGIRAFVVGRPSADTLIDLPRGH
jgi:hypothetical protein